MLPVVFALRMGNIHKDIMTLIKVALCQTDADGQRDTFVWFSVRNLRPAGFVATLLMDYIASRRRQGNGSSRKDT